MGHRRGRSTEGLSDPRTNGWDPTADAIEHFFRKGARTLRDFLTEIKGRAWQISDLMSYLFNELSGPFNEYKLVPQRGSQAILHMPNIKVGDRMSPQDALKVVSKNIRSQRSPKPTTL
jgi:hypothetical protein